MGGLPACTQPVEPSSAAGGSVKASGVSSGIAPPTQRRRKFAKGPAVRSSSSSSSSSVVCSCVGMPPPPLSLSRHHHHHHRHCRRRPRRVPLTCDGARRSDLRRGSRAPSRLRCPSCPPRSAGIGNIRPPRGGPWRPTGEPQAPLARSRRSRQRRQISPRKQGRRLCTRLAK
jgi:hypothetical protein